MRKLFNKLRLFIRISISWFQSSWMQKMMMIFDREEGDEHVATHTNKLILMTSYKMEKKKNHLRLVYPLNCIFFSFSINCLILGSSSKWSPKALYLLSHNIYNETQGPNIPFLFFYVFPCFFACKKNIEVK